MTHAMIECSSPCPGAPGALQETRVEERAAVPGDPGAASFVPLKNIFKNRSTILVLNFVNCQKLNVYNSLPHTFAIYTHGVMQMKNMNHSRMFI